MKEPFATADAKLLERSSEISDYEANSR